MSDKKNKDLLEEGSVRHFMKIAGLSKLSDGFVSKVLKEEGTGRGKLFDPHGDDPRMDNLNEFQPPDLNGKETNPLKRNADGGKDRPGDVREGEEVTEEGQEVTEEAQDVQEEGEVQEEGKGKLTPTGPGHGIESGKGVSGTGKKPTKKMQYEGKGKLTPTGPGHGIESGKGVSGTGKKPTKKMQYEGEVAEEGEQLQEFAGDDPSMGGAGSGAHEMPGSEPVGGEPDGDEGMGGGLDLQGLVQAIADAISQKTGVKVSVEGGGGEPGQEAEPELPPTDDKPEDTESVTPPMEEDGIADYHPEDVKAAKMPSGMMEGKGKKPQPKVAPKANVQSEKKKLVEAITQNVLATLSQTAAKKKPQAKK